ncbi:MAG: hypothetical protein M8364_13405 [Methylobacter sp.]|uniref:Rap1a/Tai family immunity protein n=1 Tax=Methylobacter sp. TaxID=2051955 RepID=UPI002589D7D1|nr:Rap1a/Tai family immunity protein [Methylobacter sp.]MCL7421890.1 hypothetical protein [Methylobacter sp.]
MQCKQLIVLIPLALSALAAGAEVAPENFQLKETRDLAALCSVTADDPNNVAAIHFCAGYMEGFDSYRNLAFEQEDVRAQYCMSNPLPTRDQAISLFVDWAKNHPEEMSQPAVLGLLSFAKTTWPCY